MSDFRARIVAELDTSKIPSSISKIEKQKVKLSNITLDTKGLGAKIQQALNGYQFTLNLTNVKVDNISKTITGQMRNAGNQAGQDFSQSLMNKINSTISNGGIDASISKVTAKFEQLNTVVNNMGGGTKTTELQGKLKALETEFTTLRTLQQEFAKGGLSEGELVSKYEQFNSTLAKIKNGLTVVQSEAKQFASAMEVASLNNRMETWLQSNTRATKAYGGQVQSFISELRNLSAQGNVSTADLQRISDGFKRVDMAAEQAGLKGKSFASTFKGALESITKYVSVSTLIYSAFNAIKNGVKEIVALDAALVDLQKTTSATASELKSFYFDANDIAKNLGATTKEVIQAAADWSRLGYSLKDSQTMAEVSSIFASISPGMDIQTATDGLVSAMKAFNIEADDALDGIASKINAIGNTQAVTNEDIVNFLTRSSAAMKEANNTLEETIALGTAAVEITRDADSVGNAMKTISMRIRGYDEETEEFIGGIEILEGKIADLTKTASKPGGISLFKDSAKTEYKSTYELLRDISEIYDELTDKQQANLLEKLAGKRQGQVVAAILNNFSAVEKSLQTMTNSAGSAMKEMEIIEQSLEFKLNALKETATGIFQNLFQTESMGHVIDFFTGLLNAIDKVTESLGLFGTTLLGIGIAAFIKNFSQLKVLGLEGATSIELVSAATRKMSVEDMAAALAKTNLTTAEQVQLLMTRGLTQAEAEETVALAAQSAANTTAATTTGLLTTSTLSLKAAVQGLKAAFLSNPITAIITAALTLITIISRVIAKVKEAKEEALQSAREAAQAYQGNVDSLNQTKAKLDELAPKYEKLSKGVGNLNENISLSSEEYDEYISVCNELAGMFPSLVQGYDEQGNAILSCKDNVEELTQSYYDLVEAANAAVLVQGKTLFNDFKDKSKDIKNTNFKDTELASDAVTRLSQVLNSSDLESAIEEYIPTGTTWMVQIVNALRNAGLEQGKMESGADFIRRAIQENKTIVQAIVGDFGTQMDEAIADIKPLADAYISSLLLGDEHKNITPEMQKSIRNLVQSFGFEFYDQFDNVNDMYSYLEKMMDDIDSFVGSTGAEKMTTLSDKLAESMQLEASSIKDALTDAGLSDEELNLAYQLTFTTDYESVDQLIADVRGKAEGLEVDLGKIADKLKGMVGDDGFAKSIDSYVSDVEELQTALQKLNKGTLGDSDIEKLFDKFPEMAKNSDNLEQAIRDQIEALTGYKSVVDETGQTVTEASGIMAILEDAMNNVDSDEARAELQNFMDTVLELGAVVGDTSFSIDIEAETEGMEKLYSAMKESVSSAGLSADSIQDLKERYQDLEEYDAARLFEKTANGVHLNTKALRELESAYEKQEKLNIRNTLDGLIEQYNDLTKQIEECGDEAQRAELYGKRSDILNQIEDTATLASMYDGLTSAFKRWEEAQNIGEEGDMYDSLASGLENIKQLYEDGLIGTNKFRTAVQLMSNEDLSTASIDELIAAYDAGYPIMTRYFQDGQDGCINFLEDVQKLNSEWASMNEDGSWEINFGVGNDEEIAEKLGINVEAVQSIMRKLSDYGFDINLDSVLSQLDLLKSRAEEANQKLIEIGATDITFNFGTEDIDELNSQLEQAEDLLKSLYTDDGELKVNYSEEDVENAISIIERLIYRKQSLDDAAILKVDTSNATTDIELIIQKLQNFKSQYNNLEVQTAIGADTTEATTTCNGLLEEISGMDAEILAKLGIDTTSLETLNTTINGITPEVMVTCGLDASLVEGYQAAEHNASGTVTWDNNIDKVTAWINQSHTARGTVNWGNNTSNVKTHFTATGTVKWTNASKAQGTAFSSGYWGTKNSGVALGGEIGKELVVRDGHFFTIGDDGAEFFQYEKGDIIFNAEQTRQILANGKIKNGKKRGVVYATGTAFSSGSGRFTKAGTIVGNGSYSSTPTGSGSSGSSSSGSSSSSSSSSSSDDEKEPEAFDWIEIALDRIGRTIDNLSKKAKSTFKNLSTRLRATNDEISEINSKINLSQQAAERYMQEANSVGLSADLAAKIRNGTIDINEYDEETKDLIETYKKWYEKSLDCADAVADLHDELASLYEDNFNNVKKDFDNQLALYEHLTNTYSTGIDMLEAKGYMASTEYYKALQNVTRTNISIMENQLASMEQKMAEALASGEIEYYSESWYSMAEAINDVKENIAKANVELVEFDKNIRNVEWDRFDYLQDRISQITQESDFFIDLLKDKEQYDSSGQFNNIGLTSMGLHAMNYNVYMAQADKYAKELQDINKDIANDPYNTELIKRREELLGLQQDSIKAAEDEKKAIVDLVEGGIKIELDNLKELIDTYKDALSSAKDLRDYENKISEKTEKISSLQKQLSAYSGDTSEDARATIQKLQVDLATAQKDLETTEYEQFINDEKKLLDSLYDEYSELLNSRLDNVDALVSDMIETVNSNTVTVTEAVGNMSSAVTGQISLSAEMINGSLGGIGSVFSTNGEVINGTLGGIAGDVGYTMTPIMQQIWDTATGSVNGYVAQYGEKFDSYNTNTKLAIDSIDANVQKMVDESEKEAAKTVAQETATPQAAQPATQQPQTQAPSSSPSSSSQRDEKENYGVALAIINGNYGWGVGETRKKNLTAKGFDAAHVQDIVNKLIAEGYVPNGSWQGRYYGIRDLSPYGINKFKQGGLVDYTGLAQLDGTKTKPEMVLNPTDTANFVSLRDTLRAMSSKTLTGGLMKDFADSPKLNGVIDMSEFFAELRKTNHEMQGTTVGDIHINIPIERVMDYNDFMRQLQRDDQFEEFVRSFTIDPLTGKSSIEKYKYRW